jgi:phosphatidylglycerophosphatase C
VGDRESGPGDAVTTPQLVFFDLDGTITRHDTLLHALRFIARNRPWRLPLLLRILPTILPYLVGRGDEAKVKEAFIKAALGGSTRSQLDGWIARFVPELLAHGVFANALETIAEHRRRGDYLVLMSASVDLYVPAIGRELGFAETICTGVRWDGDRLNGELTTPNRKGAEKARCFTRAREHHPGLATTAYGNSSADLPHLRLADHGVLVNGSPRARRAAHSFGVTCVNWR